jgi:manganese transport protein
MAMLLQILSLRLGLVTGFDLAQLCRKAYPSGIVIGLWLLAELGIVACDMAEVLGSALALHLLFHISIATGIVLTAFDTVIVLGLKGHGFRQIEAIICGLVATIGVCFAIELIYSPPSLSALGHGLLPQLSSLSDPKALVLVIGILGATVMPHNLYLHSSIVQTRRVAGDTMSRQEALRFSTLDALVTLAIALLVNAAILSLAATAFHGHGRNQVVDIGDAYHLLEPLLGGAAALVFGVGLLAAGQSSTFTATIAGQILLDGFLNLKIPCWQRRLITRGLAVIPALIGVLWLGDQSVGRLLILTQVVLSLQLPFAIWPLVRFTSQRQWMGRYATTRPWTITAWSVFAVICVANLWLLKSITL